MALERVGIIANGALYEGWEAVQVHWQMESPYTTFALQTTEVGDDKGLKDPANDAFSVWNFPPGTAVAVVSSNDVLVAGRVHVYNPSATHGQHSITVTGTTEGSSFVDSSVLHPTGRFEDVMDTDIYAYMAARSGNKIIDTTPPELVPAFQIKQGATYFAETARLMQEKMKLITNILPFGTLFVLGAKATPVSILETGMLVQGENIIKMSARLTDEGFAQVQVKGQNPFGNDLKQAIQIFGEALNPGVANANRHRVLLSQLATTKEAAQQRAEWEMIRAKGTHTQAQITVPGWRDSAGKYWTGPAMVYVYAPWLKIDCMMVIRELIFDQNLESGTTTTISLIDPQGVWSTFAAAACKSSSIWTGLTKPFTGAR